MEVYLNDKIIKLSNDWKDYLNNTEKQIEEEVKSLFIKKYGIEPGEDVLVIDFYKPQKINSDGNYYYRKAKFTCLDISVHLSEFYGYKNNVDISCTPIVYKYNNKILQKRPIHIYMESNTSKMKMYKMDSNLIDKPVDINKLT
jgi:hypothetical protein